jgi:uncharacterized protein
MSAPMDAGNDSAVVRELYARVARNDFDGVLALLADDAEFIQADSLPVGGRYVGRDGFMQMAQRIVAAWPGFAVAPVSFMSDGAGRVVVLTELSGQGLGMPMMELWTLHGGKVVRCQPFYFDSAAAARGAVRAAADQM